MNNFMNWNLCERNFIRRVEIDLNRIESIKEKALQRLDRAKSTKLSEKTISFIVEDYYEVIKELLIAYLLKDGLRSKNHQCLISYFYRKNPLYEKETQLISQMSFFRNRLGYYGETVPLNFYEENKLNFGKIIDILLNLLKYKGEFINK